MATSSPFDYDPDDDDQVDPYLTAVVSSRPGDDLTPDDVLAAITARPEWQQRAACRGVGTEMFFIERGGDVGPAKALCAGCAVVAECLGAAAADPMVSGIWAGLSAKGRKERRSGPQDRRA